ncbi:MAG: hypothetical protein JST48_03680 [Bacteroidetes bacterium]|nr:hypothetical protein [Bacteroidota bacterium]
METEQRGDLEKIKAANLKRARTTAIAFGAITGFALISLVHGFVQKGKVEQQRITIDSLKTEINACVQRAHWQMESARKAAEEIARQTQLLEEANSKLKK